MLRVLVGDNGRVMRTEVSRSPDESLSQAAEDERARSVLMAEAIRAAGLPCPTVSIGSTPTAFSATETTGITEIRAGVYLFTLVSSSSVFTGTSPVHPRKFRSSRRRGTASGTAGDTMQE